MLYENFERRMRRHFSFLKLVSKYRILISTIAAIAFSLSSGYSVSKGMLYDVEIPSSFVYGEELVFQSEAIFSEVEYAYRSLGGLDWGTELPHRIGDYQVRVTTNQVFGGIKEKIFDFTIIPKALTLDFESNTIPFGANPVIIAELLAGEYVDSATFSYDDLSLASTGVSIDSVVIKDQEGIDISDAYDLVYEKKTISFIPVELSIKLLDVTNIYDGAVLTSEDIEFITGTLLEGHSIIITASGSQLDVGSSLNTVLTARVYSGDIEVTNNYSVTYEEGLLEVTSRAITISTSNHQKIYDGTPLSDQTYAITQGSLVPGHHVTVIESPFITHVGETVNQLKLEIRDSEGNDVTGNYDIEYVYGSLAITQRPIKIATLGAVKVYDGTPLANQLYEISEGILVAGHTITVMESASLTHAGTIDNVMVIAINEADASDVTGDYLIEFIFGSLEVTSRPITISTSSAIKVYDGISLSNQNYDITGSLASGQVLMVTESTNITLVGVMDNGFSVAIKDSSNLDVTFNYLITYQLGKLEITPKPITIVSFDDAKVYDGTPLSNQNYDLIGGSLAAGQLINVTASAHITDVGVIDNVLNIEIRDASDIDVTNNYEISYQNGELEITLRPITVATVNDAKIYDGTPLSNQNHTITFGSLALGNRIVVIQSSHITDVGDAFNVFNIDIMDNSNIDVSHNYEISYQNGKLEITPRPITIKPIDVSKIYDGSPLTSVDALVISGNLVEGHSIIITASGSQFNVGNSLNGILTSNVFDGEIDVSGNYEITYAQGSLEVIKRPITIETVLDQKVYDGTPLSNLNFNVIEGSIVPNQTIHVVDFADITSVGIIDNVLMVEIRDSEAADVTSNYEIDFVYGSLTVTKRPITLKTATDQKVYDGTPLSNQNFEIFLGSLALGQSINVLDSSQITNVGILTNEFAIDIRDGLNVDVSLNYEISFQNGELEITVRLITIQTLSDTKVYDGLTLSNQNYDIILGSLASGQTILITSSSSIQSVGKIDNEFSLEIRDGFDHVVSSNYEISYQLGELTISLRPITIETASSIKVYDGTALSNQNYGIVLGSLATGQLINVIGSALITDVGVIDNVINLEIIDASSQVVTSNYDISFVLGTLTVTQRPITIKPLDATKIYDGVPLTSDEAVVVLGTLVGGHAAIITTSGTQTNVGSSINPILTSSIWNGDIEVTNNYLITYEDGLLTIDPRPITIKPLNVSKIYDGTVLTSTVVEVVLGSLVEGHVVLITTIGSQTNVGTSTNTILTAHIWNDVVEETSNYLITLDTGTLQILPRPITVQTSSDEKVYDGTPLSNQGHQIVLGSLVLDHFTSVNSYTLITNVGVTDNNLVILIKDGLDTDMTYNYAITYLAGSLEITPRPITIETGSSQKVYDGTPLSNQNYDLILGTLVLDHGIFLVGYTQTKDVGVVDNLLGFIIKDGLDTDMTYNYLITYQLGELEITPRPITIGTGSGVKVYDGTALSNPTYVILAGTLASGQLFYEISYTHITDAGIVDNEIEFEIRDALDNVVTLNYQVTLELGELEIIPRPLTIETGWGMKVYDDTPLSSQTYQITLGTLASFQQLHILSFTEITDVQATDNVMEFEIRDALGTNVTSNYLITYELGELEVFPRPITIETGSAEKIYDGTALSNPTYVITLGSLVSGHSLNLSSYTSIVNASIVGNILSFEIKNSSNAVVTTNYAISNTNGELKITPRPITVESGTSIKDYDGTPLSNEFIEIIEGSLVAGHVMGLVTFTEITIVGLTDNVVSVEIRDAEDEIVTSNYEITYDDGVLEVRPTVLTISTPDASKFYDGTPLTATTWELTTGAIVLNQQLTIDVTGTITDVGKAFNDFSYEILDESLNDVSDYYLVIKNIGTLEIIRVKILLIIVSESDSKAYDGTPLTNDQWALAKGELFPNHTLEVLVTGEITDVGMTGNIFTCIIRDELGNDVTHVAYDIQPEYGLLTIFDADGNGENDLESSPISSSGQFSPDMYTVLFKVFSEITDTIYLRDKSYGDYNKTGWDAPLIYISPYGVSPLAFPNLAINNSLDSYAIQIQALVSGLSYYLPYFATNGYYDNINDIYAKHAYGVGYSINYTPIGSVDPGGIDLDGTAYAEYELAYRQYVYETYLQLPKETKLALLAIASKNGLDPTDPDIIANVQNYIQGAALYNLDFKPIPDNVDYALYFLEYSREGICQHFAMAATVMYRALGIPARYVTGYAVPAAAGTWVDVVPFYAHAWVEIYIPGFGWLPVEVTGSGGGSGSGSASGSGSVSGELPSNMDDEELELIDISSLDASKIYDGLPLTNHGYYYNGNLKSGHQIEIIFSGTIIQVGEVRNTFSAKIVDANGLDVSDQYRIRTNYGLLVVAPNNEKPIIEFQLYDNVKVYSGLPVEHESTEYWIPSHNLPSGYTVEFEIVGSITEVGKIETYIDKGTIRILDVNQMDVTNQYNVVCYYGTIEIVKRSITVSSQSAQKYFDGDPLTADVFYISKGTLVSGDVITVVITGTITDVGMEDNTIASVEIMDATGKDVTDNYKITTVYGQLIVLDE